MGYRRCEKLGNIVSKRAFKGLSKDEIYGLEFNLGTDFQFSFATKARERVREREAEASCLLEA